MKAIRFARDWRLTLMSGEHHSARKRSKREWPWSRFTPPVSSRCARRRLSVSSEHTACTWQLQASIARKCRLLWCRQLLVLDTRPPLWSKGQASRLSWQAYIESWMPLKATNTRDPVTSINIMHVQCCVCAAREWYEANILIETFPCCQRSHFCIVTAVHAGLGSNTILLRNNRKDKLWLTAAVFTLNVRETFNLLHLSYIM